MFLEILKSMVEEGGGVGAFLMGYDGIAVEQYLPSGRGGDLPGLAVELSAVLKEIKKTSRILESGSLQEVSIVTEKIQILLRTLTDDYFVALVLGRDGNYGKGRYLLLRDAPRLNEALA